MEAEDLTVPATILDVRPGTWPRRRCTVSQVERSTFGVLLVRKGSNAIDGGFEYGGERLPAIGDEIEVAQPFVAHQLDPPQPLRAKVTGVEPDKSLPIRATEV